MIQEMRNTSWLQRGLVLVFGLLVFALPLPAATDDTLASQNVELDESVIALLQYRVGAIDAEEVLPLMQELTWQQQNSGTSELFDTIPLVQQIRAARDAGKLDAVGRCEVISPHGRGTDSNLLCAEPLASGESRWASEVVLGYSDRVLEDFTTLVVTPELIITAEHYPNNETAHRSVIEFPGHGEGPITVDELRPDAQLSCIETEILGIRACLVEHPDFPSTIFKLHDFGDEFAVNVAVDRSGLFFSHYGRYIPQFAHAEIGWDVDDVNDLFNAKSEAEKPFTCEGKEFDGWVTGIVCNLGWIGGSGYVEASVMIGGSSDGSVEWVHPYSSFDCVDRGHRLHPGIAGVVDDDAPFVARVLEPVELEMYRVDHSYWTYLVSFELDGYGQVVLYIAHHPGTIATTFVEIEGVGEAVRTQRPTGNGVCRPEGLHTEFWPYADKKVGRPPVDWPEDVEWPLELVA